MRNVAMTMCLLAMTACAAEIEEPKAAEEDEPLDGAFDSFRSPTSHGEVGANMPVRAELSASAGFHAWDFTLSDVASLGLGTRRAVTGGPRVDTVMYLYRKGEAGWGRYIARNDDSGSAHGFSYIGAQNLPAGAYRVLVKGHARATRGPFELNLFCSEGPGCATIPGCLFGSSWGELDASTLLSMSGEKTYTKRSRRSSLIDQQIIASADDAVGGATNLDEAFESSDEGRFTFYELTERAGTRAFTSVIYYSSDTLVGTIFVKGTTTRVASISDGDVDDCSVGTAPRTLTAVVKATFIGEVDPYVVGDACVVFAEVQTGTGSFAPGIYGLVEGVSCVNTQSYADRDGALIRIDPSRLTPSSGRARLAELSELASHYVPGATVHFFDMEEGAIVDAPLR